MVPASASAAYAAVPAHERLMIVVPCVVGGASTSSSVRPGVTRSCFHAVKRRLKTSGEDVIGELLDGASSSGRAHALAQRRVVEQSTESRGGRVELVGGIDD